jgi:alpha-tubulin suppressor-like RCC1 family protein
MEISIMNAFRFVCVALSVALAAPAFAKDASRTRLLTAPNPAKLGQTVKLVGEVDGFGGGAPTGTANFTDGDVALGAGTLSPYGAGQATLGVGHAHSCALPATGGVACWGWNYWGQLGDGTTTNRATHTPVPGLSGVVAISLGYGHSCALTTVGGVKCWGNNDYGQLGDGTTTTRRNPVAVTGLASGVVAIAAGHLHSCALTSVGAVKCWGRNDSGQLGDGTTSTRLSPVAVAHLSSGVIAVSAGTDYTCAVTSAGGAKCWGVNDSGQLGDGTDWGRSTPVAVSGLSSGVVSVEAGWSHSCALTKAGAVKCWGSNNSGQLGNGQPAASFVPVAVSGLSSGVVAITAGGSFGCALKGDGALWCWGENQYGQVGDRTITDRPTPVSVPGHTRGVVAVVAGNGHACATIGVGAFSGVLRCWGIGYFGQLGDGRSIDRRAPKPVRDFTALVRARAPFLTNSLGAGTHTLRATYSGDAAHSQSSGSRAQTIVP